MEERAARLSRFHRRGPLNEKPRFTHSVDGNGNILVKPAQTIIKRQVLYTKTRKASFNYHCSYLVVTWLF